MTPERLLRTGIIPALAELEASGIHDTVEARRFLLAIALQESGAAARRQSGMGPAASYFQFEQGGGCRGVLAHPAAAKRMHQVCADYDIEPTEAGLWQAMRYNDIVAACAARLLIYTLPAALPVTSMDGWAQYLSAWRPGQPRPKTWEANWATADKVARA